jgi:hypothetical protein
MEIAEVSPAICREVQTPRMPNRQKVAIESLSPGSPAKRRRPAKQNGVRRQRHPATKSRPTTAFDTAVPLRVAEPNAVVDQDFVSCSWPGIIAHCCFNQFPMVSLGQALEPTPARIDSPFLFKRIRTTIISGDYSSVPDKIIE